MVFKGAARSDALAVPASPVPIVCGCVPCTEASFLARGVIFGRFCRNASMSLSIIRPLGPLPVICRISTASLSASFLARGEMNSADEAEVFTSRTALLSPTGLTFPALSLPFTPS